MTRLLFAAAAVAIVGAVISLIFRDIDRTLLWLILGNTLRAEIRATRQEDRAGVS